MGSLRFDGVRFTVYTMDHKPRHVHGFYADIEVIVDLLPAGAVALASRTTLCDRATQAGQMCDTYSRRPLGSSRNL